MKSPVALVYDYVTSQFATIKPSSTAAVAADPALVVAISPNNPITASVDAAKIADLSSSVTKRYATVSPFGRIRTAEPRPLFDNYHKYEINADEWGQLVASGGAISHVPLKSSAQLSVTGTNGSSALLRTHTFFRYQTGLGLQWRVTCPLADTGQTNQNKDWGLFDDDDGTFFRLSGTTFQIVVRNSVSGAPVETVYNQSAFNIDKLDGSGPSGINKDLTRGNIWGGDFQWLGYGGILFLCDEFPVHFVANANLLTAPWARTPQLPISFKIYNTGASVASSMMATCGQAAIDGGEDPPEYSGCAYNASDVSVTTTERPVLSIRPKTTYNSVVNRMLILPKFLIGSTEGARTGWRLVMHRGATLTGASFTSADSRSGVDFDVAATALTGGTQTTLVRGFMANANDQTGQIQLDKVFGKLQRKLRLDAFGSVQDTLTILMVNEAAGTTLCRSSFTWGEVR